LTAAVSVIFNADDFGLTRSICDAVEKSHREGVLTSATLLSGSPHAMYAAEIARRNPSLSVGLHFQLVAGTPVTADLSRIRTLVGPDGRFCENYVRFFRKFHTGGIDKNEIMIELLNQARRAYCLGVKPTHADSHQHIHMHPALLPVFVEAARVAGIKKFRDPVEPYRPALHGRLNLSSGNIIKAAVMNPFYKRWYARRMARAGMNCPSLFFGQYCSGRMTADRMATFLEYIKEKYIRNIECDNRGGLFVEIMTHPGLSAAEFDSIELCDDDFRKYQWRGEFDALVSGPVVGAFAGGPMRLAGYSEL